jgi:hypothetical protein
VSGILLVLAGACPRSAGDRPHTWQPGDTADLVGYGHPDHGLTVALGRCRFCGTPLLAVETLTGEDLGGGRLYEARGAEL